MLLQPLKQHNLLFLRVVSALVALAVATVGTLGFINNIELHPQITWANFVRDAILFLACAMTFALSTPFRLSLATYVFLAGLLAYLTIHFWETGTSSLPGGILPLLILIIAGFVLGRRHLWTMTALLIAAAVATLVPASAEIRPDEVEGVQAVVSWIIYIFVCLLLTAIVDRTVIVLRMEIVRSERRRMELDAAMSRVSREVELRKAMQDRLVKSSGLEASCFISAALSHDFGNLLNVVLGYAQQLGMRVEEKGQSDLRRPLNGLVQAAERAADLNRRILSTIRVRSADPVILDLPATMDTVRLFLEASLGANISLSVCIEALVGAVVFDEAALVLILLNLAANSKDALSGKGNVRINVFGLDERVVIRFEDSGPPIPPQIRSQLFNPFFTTKPPGKGAGLGLFTSSQLAMSFGGMLSMGEGDRASFELSIPRAEFVHPSGVSTST